MISTRSVTYSERNTDIDAPNVIPVPANTATKVLPYDNSRDEIASRYIQNVGQNGCYYSFGVWKLNADGVTQDPVCNDVNVFHGYLAAGQQLDCTAHRKIVSVYCPGAATTISTTVVRRKDSGRRN